MNRRLLTLSLAGLLSAGLAACAAFSPAPQPTPAPAVERQTAPTVAPAPTTAAPQPATAPQPGSAQTALESSLSLSTRVSGSGEVKASQDASLVFLVPGTVDRVLVTEGDQVKKDQVLAVLDVRSFDLDVRRAEAALAAALAQQSSLQENPRAADIAAANAQVRQAEANLAAIKAGPKIQDIESAQAALSAAQANLQATRDRLSAAKTNAQFQMEQAANQLRNAQDQYSRIYWQNREAEAKLDRFGMKLPKEAIDAEAAALRGVQNAEVALEQARLAYEAAQQGEVTGIQAAEQQVAQAQAAVEKITLPPDNDRLAAAEAALAQARAARARLIPDPTDSQEAQVAAGVEQATVGVELAKLNRERAELRAPFDGVIAAVNIDPGDPASTGSLPAISIVDVSKLQVEVPISDVDIAKVRVGQQVTLYAEALAGKVFTGTIGYVAPTANIIGTIRTYTVRVDLYDQEGLRPGMSLRVDIKTQ